MVLLGLLLGACTATPEALTEEERAVVLTLSPLPAPPPSPGNPHADEPAAAALGERLFFEERLSADGRVSCATCHDPERSFTDGLPRAIGQAPGHRNTPTVLGAAHHTFLTWDGRKDSLWSQALAPLEDELEHGSSRVAVARVIREHHREAFELTFGALPEDAWFDGLPLEARPVPDNPDHPHHRAWRAMSEDDRDRVDRIFVGAGQALEAFQRTLVPGETPFDRYVAAVRAGDPRGGGHLSPGAVRGLRAFVGEAQCVTCHSGPWLTDRAFHNLGLPPVPGDSRLEGRAAGARLLLADPFRCGGPHSAALDCPELRHLDPDLPPFLGAWRTPTLRQVAETGPYMHGGQLRTLDEVLAFYRELPGEAAVGEREALLQHVDPRIPVADLRDFLEALSADGP